MFCIFSTIMYLPFVQRTSLPVFFFFQRCFPRCFQLCLGCCQLGFSSVAVDLERQSFWMESFWSPESIVWWKLRTFLCGWKLILSTKQWFVLSTPIADLTCPDTGCWSSRLLATHLVVCGLGVASPSGGMPRHLLPRVYDEFGPKQFICVHQLHPCLCRLPLARPCRCQPTGDTVPSAFGLVCCFHHSCSSCDGDWPGVCCPFHFGVLGTAWYPLCSYIVDDLELVWSVAFFVRVC